MRVAAGREGPALEFQQQGRLQRFKRLLDADLPRAAPGDATTGKVAAEVHEYRFLALRSHERERAIDGEFLADAAQVDLHALGHRQPRRLPGQFVEADQLK